MMMMIVEVNSLVPASSSGSLELIHSMSKVVIIMTDQVDVNHSEGEKKVEILERFSWNLKK
jgi:hypothetical protein